jgi:hypothetical protein
VLPLCRVTSTPIETPLSFVCRRENSWERGLRPPVIFMGLLDTVGAEGFPHIRFNAAPPDMLTYDYGFYDTHVSSEVQHVFQAASTHNRLGLFQPCPVLRNPGVAAAETAPDGYTGRHYRGVKFSTREVWYPGMRSATKPRSAGAIGNATRACKQSRCQQHCYCRCHVRAC